MYVQKSVLRIGSVLMEDIVYDSEVCFNDIMEAYRVFNVVVDFLLSLSSRDGRVGVFIVNIVAEYNDGSEGVVVMVEIQGCGGRYMASKWWLDFLSSFGVSEGLDERLVLLTDRNWVFGV